MRIIIKNDYEECCLWVAEYIAHSIITFAPVEDRPFVLGLPTGSTPLGVYKCLQTMHKQKKISFKHVVTFNMDEYIGIKREHPQSYYTFMHQNFFNGIDIDIKNTHIPNGNADDLVKECEKYEKKIEAVGGIRLFLAGIGVDAHIAFNEPGSSFSSRTRIKTLMKDTQIANSRFFKNDINVVPKTALTVGIGTVMDSKEVILIATGYKKAHALQKCVEEGINHKYPASCLQMHPKTIVVCDSKATDELTVRTVRYFREIEGSHI